MDMSYCQYALLVLVLKQLFMVEAEDAGLPSLLLCLLCSCSRYPPQSYEFPHRSSLIDIV